MSDIFLMFCFLILGILIGMMVVNLNWIFSTQYMWTPELGMRSCLNYGGFEGDWSWRCYK
jgi:hypothetical protein